MNLKYVVVFGTTTTADVVFNTVVEVVEGKLVI